MIDIGEHVKNHNTGNLGIFSVEMFGEMKRAAVKKVLAQSCIGLFALGIICFFLMALVHLWWEVRIPVGYAMLKMSSDKDVARHVSFVLSEQEGAGREISDKIKLINILSLDAEEGSKLSYDRTVLVKYAGRDMLLAKGDVLYEEPMMNIAAILIMGGMDYDLVKATFHHYRADETSVEHLCGWYLTLKSRGDYYNPEAITYCPD